MLCLINTGDMSQVLAGLKDGSIHWVDVKSNTNKVIVQESAPILSFCIDEKESLLWVSTTNSCVNAWKLDLSSCDEAIRHSTLPAVSAPNSPVKSIPGKPRIKDFSILKDRRHVLTKNTDNEIQLWDIMYAKFVKSLGSGELEAFREEEERKMMNNLIPNWFSVRIKTGLISICIEEVGWKSAWIVASQTDLPGNESPGVKYNLGCLVLLGIFKPFTSYHKASKEENGAVDKEEKSIDTDFVTVPDHTPIILTESDDSGIVLCRILSKDVAGPSEREKLQRMLPTWALNYLLNRDLPQQLKINFTIVPHKSITTTKTAPLFNPSRPTRLNGCDTVSIRKIIDYIYEQINKTAPEGDKAVDLIEVLCNGQVLTLDSDMRSIKYHIWKSSSDLKLEYRYKVTENGEEKDDQDIGEQADSNP